MPGKPLKVFLSYSHKDGEALKNKLKVHLASLIREKTIAPWQDRQIEAGAEWDLEIKTALESAQIILLLITPHFLDSRYCYDEEMQRAMQRHKEGKARVIPIIMEPSDWQNSPFSKLQVLPRDGEPVTLWKNENQALLSVVSELRRVINSMTREDPRQAGIANPIASPSVQPANPTFEFEVVTVNAQGGIAKRHQRQAEYFTEDLGIGVRLELVKIPGGRFQMGSPMGEEGSHDSQRPQHSVTVPEFWMGKYLVTQTQYQAVMGRNPSHFSKNGDNRPVEQVSWHDAVEFCEKLSRQTGHAYRLPSEAEWEYACRAGANTPFYFGPTITTDLANYRGKDFKFEGKTYPGNYGNGPYGSFREETTNVGSFSPNAFGLYDMHGNVWEWCVDHWHENYAGAPTDGTAWLSSDQSSYRLLRGGSWKDLPESCRSADRDRGYPDMQYYNIGFRVVCSPPRILQ